jgi:hypothetical protein
VLTVLDVVTGVSRPLMLEKCASLALLLNVASCCARMGSAVGVVAVPDGRCCALLTTVTGELAVATAGDAAKTTGDAVPGTELTPCVCCRGCALCSAALAVWVGLGERLRDISDNSFTTVVRGRIFSGVSARCVDGKLSLMITEAV